MGQKLSWLLADEEAGRLYRRRPGLVAFVDESYRALSEGSAYIMTGVIADTSQFNDYRRGLVENLQSNTFHAVAARANNPMDIDDVDVVNTLVQQRSDVLASVMVGTQDLEDDDVKSQVRQQVLGALARQLHESWGVNTIVADHLVDGDRQREDEVTMRRGRDAGVPVELLHSHPGREKMLWTADATAWAVSVTCWCRGPGSGKTGSAFWLTGSPSWMLLPGAPCRAPCLALAMRTAGGRCFVGLFTTAPGPSTAPDSRRRSTLVRLVWFRLNVVSRAGRSPRCHGHGLIVVGICEEEHVMNLDRSRTASSRWPELFDGVDETTRRGVDEVMASLGLAGWRWAKTDVADLVAHWPDTTRRQQARSAGSGWQSRARRLADLVAEQPRKPLRGSWDHVSRIHRHLDDGHDGRVRLAGGRQTALMHALEACAQRVRHPLRRPHSHGQRPSIGTATYIKNRTLPRPNLEEASRVCS